MINKLNFNNQNQKKNSWCWAAVSLGIAKFYDSNTLFTQCLIVSAAFQGVDCNTIDQSCDLGNVLSTVTQKFNISKNLGFDDIQTELSKSHPIAADITWDNGDGTGHCIVICGCEIDNSNQKYIYIADPLLKDGVSIRKKFDTEFCNGYTNGLPNCNDGMWMKSYLTQPNNNIG